MRCTDLRCLSGSSVFPHYLINATIFGGGVIEHRFFLTFVSSISNYMNLARYDQNLYWSSRKVPVILDRF